MLTKRIVIPEMEEIVNKPFNVLDKGEIRVIEYMGSDETIVNAARVSYGQGTKTTRDNKGLINYLLRNSHTSPFEMCELLLYIKLPIFIAAQWVRHRTANINSYSARYSILKDEFYIPSPEQLKTQSKNNKQCSGDVLPFDIAVKLSESIDAHCANSYKLYEEMISQGLSRELARMVLPQNIYTCWYWKIDLHNLLHFLKLRTHEHAQSEIREYANVILGEIVAKWVPMTYSAFCEHKVGSVVLSVKGQCVLKDRLTGELNKTREEYEIGKGEWDEIEQMLSSL